ncbi:MAG: sensor histidine kinase, partial [Desulfovibrionaceae bacterium]
NKLSLAIAHQLRNPLTAIGGFAGLLRRRLNGDAVAVSYLESILDSGRRLEDVVKAVTAYTSLKLGPFQRLPLQDLVDEACKTLRHRLPHMAENICWRQDVAPVQVEVDPAFMVRALTEILANSAESLNGSRDIRVTADAFAGLPVIEIVDTGQGIHPEDLPYIFDPFFTTKAVGVGMGLPLAERIVKEHGGRIQVSSQPGHGSRVRIHLHAGEQLREAAPCGP